MADDVARVTPEPPSDETMASGRGPDGRFRGGNIAALKHGGRSTQVRAASLSEQSVVRAQLADKRDTIVGDLGGDAQLSQLQRDLIDRYLELDVVAQWLGGNLVADGPLTAKGRARAALSAYVTIVDRVHRVSSALGLGRKQRQVSLSGYLATTYPLRDGDQGDGEHTTS